MTTAYRAPTTCDLDRAVGCLLLVNTGSPTRLSLIPPGRRTAWLARLRRRSLDARLAAGESPESSLVLAVRAAQLVDPASRRRLADQWDALAVEARRCAGPYFGVPREIQQLTDLLCDARPPEVRGIVMAAAMLPVAAVSVYRRGTQGEDVAAAAARTAIAAM